MVADMDNDEEQLQHVYVSIRKMPKPNHDLLERVFFHLARYVALKLTHLFHMKKIKVGRI